MTAQSARWLIGIVNGVVAAVCLAWEWKAAKW